MQLNGFSNSHHLPAPSELNSLGRFTGRRWRVAAPAWAFAVGALAPLSTGAFAWHEPVLVLIEFAILFMNLVQGLIVLFLPALIVDCLGQSADSLGEKLVDGLH